MRDIIENNFISGLKSKEVEEKTKEILKALPGGDCGGHGGCKCFSCRACSEAIAEGASIALCPACSAECINTIASIMGVQPVMAKDEVAFVRCAGEAAGKSRFVGLSSCDDIVKEGFLTDECRHGCVGIGSCVERCKFGAMTLEEGTVIIDKDKCNGCRACIGMCPQALIVMVPREASNFIPCASKDAEELTRKICGRGCIGCGDCEEVCPELAVTIVDNCAVINYEKCVGCVACTIKCRKKIIVDEIHDLTKVKEMVAFVRCRGGKRANDNFAFLEVKNCTDACKIREESMDFCQIGCVGLEDCIKVCRYDAIDIIDGTAHINPEKCVGCLDCIGACPNGLIVEVPYVGSKLVACASPYDSDAKLGGCSKGCIACGDCISNCPNGAIAIKNLHANVDSNLCENCSICSYMCSRNAFVEMVVPESNYLQRKALGI